MTVLFESVKQKKRISNKGNQLPERVLVFSNGSQRVYYRHLFISYNLLLQVSLVTKRISKKAHRYFWSNPLCICCATALSRVTFDHGIMFVNSNCQRVKRSRIVRTRSKPYVVGNQSNRLHVANSQIVSVEVFELSVLPAKTVGVLIV